MQTSINHMSEHIPWWQVDLGKEAAHAASQAVCNRLLSQGPITQQVENRFKEILHIRHAIATSSGSTALTLALMTAGAKPGDTVVCPAYTWIATAHAAHILGCSIELVDILPNAPVMDVAQVPPSTNQRKIALPVHMNGHAVDIKTLKDKGYIVIEDAAQALGSSSRDGMLGTIGDIGCYSFSVSKIIGSGQGGLLVTNSDSLDLQSRTMRTHGVLDVFAPNNWEKPGHNFRYNDIMAAVLLTQIPLLNSRLDHIRAITNEYIQRLSDLDLIRVVTHRTDEELGPYVEAQTHPDYRQLVRFLSKNNIERGLYFPH